MHYAVDNDYNDRGKHCRSAPLLYQTQKWLREKGLEVYAIIARAATYEWGVYHIPSRDNIACNMGANYETYETALSSGDACARN